MTIEPENFDWNAPALSSDDQELIAAYTRTGIPLDSLAYTDEFPQLVKEAGGDPENPADLRRLYRRLLSLRKRSMLPRIYAGSVKDAG